MPNSHSNKPGFYEGGDEPATNTSNNKSADSNKPAQDAKKSKGGNDNAKRSVNRSHF